MLSDMKNILMITALLGFASVAAAQDTAPAAPATNDTAPATTDPASAAPAATPAEAYAKAQELAVQADVAYPVSFYDRTLWKAAVTSAYQASTGEPANRDYMAYLGQLYTKTQWWINGYTVWSAMTDLNDTEKEWAALTAAKLAYIALQRGDKEAARAYVTKGMGWKSTPSLTAIMSRL